MQQQKITNKRAGFQRAEFQAIIGLANEFPNIKDSRPFQQGDHVSVCLHRDAAKSPAIWIEKYQNGPQKSLFVAYSPGIGHKIVPVARSEKFDHFMEQLREKLDIIDKTHTASRSDSTVSVLSPEF